MSPDYWLGMRDAAAYINQVLYELEIQGGKKEVSTDIGDYVRELYNRCEKHRYKEFARQLDVHSPFRRDAPEEWEKEIED